MWHVWFRWNLRMYQKRRKKEPYVFIKSSHLEKKNLVWLPIEKVTYLNLLNKANLQRCCKNIFHIQVQFLIYFATSPIKLKLWDTEKQVRGGGGGEGTSKIPKPPGQIIMIDQSEILSISQILFITLFFSSAHPGHCCCVIDQPVCAITVEPKNDFLDSKSSYFGDFSSSNKFLLCNYFLDTNRHILGIFRHRINSYCAGSHTEHHWRSS